MVLNDYHIDIRYYFKEYHVKKHGINMVSSPKIHTYLLALLLLVEHGFHKKSQNEKPVKMA